MSRWQRERRQQAVIVSVFTAVLVFVVALATWAAADRYYRANLAAAAEVQGRTVPMREYQRQQQYEYVQLYLDYGVPPGFENDPQLGGIKGQYDATALDRLVEHRVLDLAARDQGIAVTDEQVDLEYEIRYGEVRVRHILIGFKSDAEDRELDDLTAQARARGIVDRLRAAPSDQELWNRLAEEHSDDPGSKFSGGELGFGGSGQYVAEFEDALRRLEVGRISDPIRTVFGYHVIQIQEKREAGQTDLVKKYAQYGFTAEELRRQARYLALRREFERRAIADATRSPQEQVRLARILVNIPNPTLSGGFEEFTAALQRSNDARTAVEEGKDFADVAGEFSDVAAEREKGGEMGWLTRWQLTSPEAERLVFAAEPGATTTPISSISQWVMYKVLEKDPARELTDEQKSEVARSAYGYWLERQKAEYGAQKLVPGLTF